MRPGFLCFVLLASACILSLVVGIPIDPAHHSDPSNRPPAGNPAPGQKSTKKGCFQKNYILALEKCQKSNVPIPVCAKNASKYASDKCPFSLQVPKKLPKPDSGNKKPAGGFGSRGNVPGRLGSGKTGPLDSWKKLTNVGGSAGGSGGKASCIRFLMIYSIRICAPFESMFQ